MKHIAFMLCTIIACDPGLAEHVELREGSSGGECLPEPPPPAPSLAGCLCDPDDAGSCKPGLDCVPTGNGKEHACLARCGGGSITACQTEGALLPCIYPYLDEQIGTGPAYCPACLSCTPPPVGTMICQ